MNSLRNTSLALLAVGLGACIGRPVPPAGPRMPPAAPPAAGPNLVGPWRAAATGASQRVSVTTRAILNISDEALARTDTLSATLDARFTVLGRDQRIEGSLLDYRVAQGTAPATAPAGLVVPKTFSVASTAPGGLVFRVPAEASACSDPALSILQGMYDAWIPLPDSLVTGREWSDTVHTVSCRDRLPVRGTNVRRFRVQRADAPDGRVLLTIERRAKGTVSGTGDQFGEPVSFDGTSSGTMSYVLDVAAGQLVRATGASTLELTFKSPRRNQRVRQDSDVTLAWMH